MSGLLDRGIAPHLGVGCPCVGYQVTSDLEGAVHSLIIDVLVPRGSLTRLPRSMLDTMQHASDAGDSPRKLAGPVRHATQLAVLCQLGFYPGGELSHLPLRLGGHP